MRPDRECRVTAAPQLAVNRPATRCLRSCPLPRIAEIPEAKRGIGRGHAGTVISDGHGLDALKRIWLVLDRDLGRVRIQAVPDEFRDSYLRRAPESRKVIFAYLNGNRLVHGLDLIIVRRPGKASRQVTLRIPGFPWSASLSQDRAVTGGRHRAHGRPAEKA